VNSTPAMASIGGRSERMIRTFADKNTERLLLRENIKRFGRKLQRAGLRKLILLDEAESLEDLRVPPGNRLEKLTGDREGQHSIRINDHGESVFAGAKETRTKSKLPIIIRGNQGTTKTNSDPSRRGVAGRFPPALGPEPIPFGQGGQRSASAHQRNRARHSSHLG
jgi:proteic killer suppression protein